VPLAGWLKRDAALAAPVTRPTRGWSSIMQYNVTGNYLLDAANTCRRTNDSIQAQIGEIQSYIAGLMGAYQGPAATQLQNTSEMWRRDAAALNQVLLQIASNLDVSAHNYGDAEVRAHVALENVASVLGNAFSQAKL
jgi:WXG100 family type VII secretion target